MEQPARIKGIGGGGFASPPQPQRKDIPGPEPKQPKKEDKPKKDEEKNA